jgi:hypothetical protein
MGCRKNQAQLTSGERAAFVNAVLKLKNETPSQLGLASRYDDYVQIHMNSMMATPGWAHQGPAFLPWHRELLRQFEMDLQAIDPTVSIPYWDWTVDQDPTLPTSPFTNDFMGGNGDPGNDDKVMTGPFAEANGKWHLNVITGDEYFIKIQAGINNSTAVLDPRGELVFGATHKIPFRLTSADHGVDVVLLSPAPFYIDFRLETPDGKILTPAVAAAEPAMEFVSTPRVSYYRASLPMVGHDPDGSHAGVWYVILRLSDRARDADRKLIASIGQAALPYSLLVHAYSDLVFRPKLLQTSFEPGATVQLRVALDQNNAPLQTPATCWAEIQEPDGASTTLALAPTSSGRYAASFTADVVGVYTALVRARGITLDGQQFEREQRLTATVFVGGDQPAPKPGDDRLCQLLRCLLGGKIIGTEVERALAGRGIDLRALLACVERHCRDDDGTLGGEHPAQPDAAGRPLQAMLDEVRAALAVLEQQAAAGPAHFAELVHGQPVPIPTIEPMIMNFGLGGPTGDKAAPRKHPKDKGPR